MPTVSAVTPASTRMAAAVIENGPARPSVAPVVSFDETTRRLLDSAVEVFAEKGYDKAGVAEIARRAGLTTGAIYGRFAGKAELLAAAITGTVPDELALLFAERAFDGRVTDVLRSLGSHLVTREASAREGLLLEAFVAARRDPEVAQVLREAFEVRRRRTVALVEAGQNKGLIDPALDPLAVVHFAQAVGLGFLGYEAIGLAHPDARAWDAVIAKVMTSIAPPETEPESGDHADPTSPPNVTN